MARFFKEARASFRRLCFTPWSTRPGTPSSRPKRTWFAAVEILGVFVLIEIYIWRLRFLVPSAWMGIVALMIASHVVRKETPAKLGLGWGDCKSAFRQCAPALLVVAAALLAGGLAAGSLRSGSWLEAVGGIVYYSLWGFVQQYALNGYFTNRLRAAHGDSGRVAVLAALLFAAAHTPNWFLMAVTFPAGWVCARIYLRHRSLWFLGVAHGVVGFLLHSAVPETISGHFYVGPKLFR